MKINLTIERFTDDKAILKGDDGVSLSWPKDKLPAAAKEKDIIIFSLKPAANEPENDNLAKDILNEILNIE